jgi:REP element-mobilizing transposase RayT
MLYLGRSFDTIEQEFLLYDLLVNPSYFVDTVSKNTENQIKEYISNQITKDR